MVGLIGVTGYLISTASAAMHRDGVYDGDEVRGIAEVTAEMRESSQMSSMQWNRQYTLVQERDHIASFSP